jgi:polyferredoxin
MKIPNNVFRYRYHTLRPWLVQPFFWVLFFLSPLLDWFRVDMITQKIIFLGTAYPFVHQYIQWIPIGFYGGVLLIALASVLMGRVFCGWVCPHNTLTEWTRPLRALVGREPMSRQIKLIFRDRPVLKAFVSILSPLWAITLTFFLTFALASYVVSPQWILEGYTQARPHIALVFGQILFTLIGLFLLYCGHDFCRTCCPYGMGQSISAYMGGKWNPMEIRFGGDKESQCKTCTACQSACPVDLDPRNPLNLKVGQFDGCFNCGECIDACKTVKSYRKTPGLLSFAPPQVVKKQAH